MAVSSQPLSRPLVAVALAALVVACRAASSTPSSADGSKVVFKGQHDPNAMQKWAAVLADSFLAMGGGTAEGAKSHIDSFTSMARKEISQNAKSLQTVGPFDLSSVDLAGDLQKLINDGGPFNHPPPQVSVNNPTFFADGTANVSSTVAGVSISSAFVNYAPCLISNTPFGVGIFPTGINVQPQIIGIAPAGVNVQPQGGSIAPTLIFVGPIADNVQPQGLTIAPALISISPVRTVINPVGPLARVDVLGPPAVSIPKGPQGALDPRDPRSFANSG